MMEGDGTLEKEGRDDEAHCILCDAGEQAAGESSQDQRKRWKKEIEVKRRRQIETSCPRKRTSIKPNYR